MPIAMKTEKMDIGTAIKSENMCIAIAILSKSFLY